MADEDEELSHLRAPDANDIDLTEETQDFRFFNKLTFVRLPTLQSITATILTTR